MDVCEDYMISTIAAENFSKLCLFAELYHLSKLSKVDCLIYLVTIADTFKFADKIC
ncbi:unnamed protein product [Meloidogyne enterolobii]|uniref:Uncharacterized protein n=1 Tax=Meloidogyne enterolobii TaxID=390850 RepID=A0ACB0ZVT8_MELEN